MKQQSWRGDQFAWNTGALPAQPHVEVAAIDEGDGPLILGRSRFGTGSGGHLRQSWSSAEGQQRQYHRESNCGPKGPAAKIALPSEPPRHFKPLPQPKAKTGLSTNARFCSIKVRKRSHN